MLCNVKVNFKIDSGISTRNFEAVPFNKNEIGSLRDETELARLVNFKNSFSVYFLLI